MVVAGELPDTLMATTADQPSVMAMVADTGDMDMDTDMDMDMEIAVSNFRGLRPPFFARCACGAALQQSHLEPHARRLSVTLMKTIGTLAVECLSFFPSIKKGIA
jgi:hypothetical protein